MGGGEAEAAAAAASIGRGPARSKSNQQPARLPQGTAARAIVIGIVRAWQNYRDRAFVPLRGGWCERGVV